MVPLARPRGAKNRASDYWVVVNEGKTYDYEGLWHMLTPFAWKRRRTRSRGETVAWTRAATGVLKGIHVDSDKAKKGNKAIKEN